MKQQRYPLITDVKTHETLPLKQWVIDKVTMLPFISCALIIPALASITALFLPVAGIRINTSTGSFIYIAVVLGGGFIAIFISSLTGALSRAVEFSNLRRILAQSGVLVPIRFMMKHPRNLLAYEHVAREITGRPDRVRLPDLEHLFMIAALVFTSRDAYLKADQIIHIVMTRDYTNCREVAEILATLDELPNAISEGAL